MTFGELLHNKTLLVIFYFLNEYPRVFYTTLPFLSISSLALLSLILSYKKKYDLFHVQRSEDKIQYFSYGSNYSMQNQATNVYYFWRACTALNSQELYTGLKSVTFCSAWSLSYLVQVFCGNVEWPVLEFHLIF